MDGTGVGLSRWVPNTWQVVLSIIFLAGLALRLYGLDWDDGADLHPDELFVAKIVLVDRIHLEWPPDIARLLDPERSGLNPRSADPATGRSREFAYGALPLWVTDFSAWTLSRVTGTDWNGIDHAYLVGRSISALLSALTILPVAALGTKAGGKSIGLLAALFAAIAPMSIQLAHFFTTDSWLTFFVAVCLLAAVSAAECGGAWRFFAAGIAFGLAMATKGSVFTLAVPIAIAVVIDASRRSTTTESGTAFRSSVRNAFASMLAGFLGFIVFEPYALLRPRVFLQSLRTQADIVSGAFDVPFTRVYSGTIPLVYQLEQFLRWGYGPVAGLLALLGLGIIAFAAIRHRSSSSVILVSWAVSYGAVLLVADAKFLRYLEPLAPVFAVAASVALVRASTALHHVTRVRLATLLTPLAIVLAVAWTGAFLSIYAHENPRIAATKWIYGSIPPGAVLTAEYWDDPLPRALAYGMAPQAFGFGFETLDLYRDLPPPEARDVIYEGISKADFVVQSSRRVEAAIRAAPWRYPVQGRFFDLLERGRLGFSHVAEFARQPTFGGVPVDDRSADESFLNYDHPGVTIYERVSPLATETYNDLMAWALQRPWFPAREPPQPTLLLDRPVGENPSLDDARWSEALTGSTPAALVVWILLMAVLLVAGVPIARMAFPAFPDAGIGLARMLGLVVAAYPVWLGASLQLIPYRAVWIVASLALVAILGWWKCRPLDWSPSRGSSRSHARLWMHAEAAFWLVFVFFLVLRILNPDGWHPIWGGEKPMEFAQINAIGRSAYFPPYDPWFADGYVNYYYYGIYLVSFLLKATGIPSEIGFNLAQPTFMALLASCSFSCGAALGKGVTRSSRMALLAGWGAVLAVAILGNLSVLRGAIDPHAGFIDPFVRWTWNGSRAIDNAITEFPYFTGLYADLHAHVVALPLTVLVIALCLSLATIRRNSKSDRRDVLAHPQDRMIALIILLALVLGTLGTTNAWDVPVYAALSIAAVLMATENILSWTRRVTMFLLGSLAIGGGAWLLFLPFHRHFVALFSQIAIVRDPTELGQFLSHFGGLVAVCAIGLTILLWPRASSCQHGTLWPLGAIGSGTLGLMLATRSGSGPLVGVGELLLCAAIAGPPLSAAWFRSDADSNVSSWSSRGTKLVISSAALGVMIGIAAGRSVFGLLVAIGAAAAIGWWRIVPQFARFVCLLLAAGFFTAAGVEIIVVADDLIETSAYRMNTVFKFYNQVWILLALASATLVALMVRELIESRSARSRGQAANPMSLVWSRFGLALTAALTLISLSYPILATGPRLAQRFAPSPGLGTLNALAWMDHGSVPILESSAGARIRFDGDAAAIAWLLEHVAGTPVVAEASIGPYRCNGSRISIATGLPTIIGWERHQQQQRYAENLTSRVHDVRTLYTSSDLAEKATILYRYNVEYVIVGDLERFYPIPNNECTPTGSLAGIAAFEDMVGQTLDVAHSEAGTTIYRVKPIGSGA